MGNVVDSQVVRSSLFLFLLFTKLYSYEDLELFKELEPADLDYLGILSTEHRAKLLAAVQLLNAIDSNGSGDGNVVSGSSEADERPMNPFQKKNSLSPFERRHFPRDSGCYEGSLLPTLNSLQNSADPVDDMMAAQCSSDIFKRLEHQEASSKKGFVKKGLLGGASIADDICFRGEGGALSEKSSDSGVSSSSLSATIKNNL